MGEKNHDEQTGTNESDPETNIRIQDFFKKPPISPEIDTDNLERKMQTTTINPNKEINTNPYQDTHKKIEYLLANNITTIGTGSIQMKLTDLDTNHPNYKFYQLLINSKYIQISGNCPNHS